MCLPPLLPHFCHPQDSKFRLILIESRVHRIARYYKKVIACASELGLYVSVFRVLLRIFGWGFGFGFGFFVSAQHCVGTHFAAAFVRFYVLSTSMQFTRLTVYTVMLCTRLARCHHGTASHS